jgi:uncharacterized phiE125 gp8 family phage protein
MSITIITSPAAEPLGLAEAKQFLAVVNDDEDDLIAALIVAARETVEAASGRALIVRRVVETLDQWSFDRRGALALSLTPVSAVYAVRVAGPDGAMATLESGGYALDAAGARLWFSTPPPSPASSIAGIEIEYEAGFGAAASAVPEALRQAVRLTLSAAYEDRRGGAALPEAARGLIGALRVPRL